MTPTLSILVRQWQRHTALTDFGLDALAVWITKPGKAESLAVSVPAQPPSKGAE